MGTAGLLSLLIAPFNGGITHAPINLHSILALSYLIIFGSILAYSAYIFLSKVWPPAKAGTYAYWNPVVAVLLGCWIRGETFHARMVPGLFLILLGVGLVQVPWELIRRISVRCGSQKEKSPLKLGGSPTAMTDLDRLGGFATNRCVDEAPAAQFFQKGDAEQSVHKVVSIATATAYD